MDRNKLIYIAQLPQGEALLIEALSGDDRVLVPELVQRFGVADVLAAVKDQPFMASLLYFFGILTLNGLTVFDECRQRIPNLVARGLHVERLRGRWWPATVRANTLPDAVRAAGQQGDFISVWNGTKVDGIGVPPVESLHIAATTKTFACSCLIVSLTSLLPYFY